MATRVQNDQVVTTVVARKSTQQFSLVGVTWAQPLTVPTTFHIQTRCAGRWSTWLELHSSDDHAVNEVTNEAHGIRYGTDPLLTNVCDGVTLIARNPTGEIPTGLELHLINSPVTAQDRKLVQSVRTITPPFATTVTSPQGAVVERPTIISRAAWGANESWRDATPRMGNTIIAGFIHHTATTNTYTREQAPKQMRNLYAYFTQSLKYADMGYNFLVDKYGTIYEGRAGCAIDSTAVCDGPSLPVQGAHTAGMNENTFAVSVIGNFDTTRPTTTEAAAIVDSLSQLSAWKFAPYGLMPANQASIPSTDTSGLSRTPNGQVAVTPTLSAHRDVGLTVCPGRYLYPYMSRIRTNVATLLKPVLQNVGVTPTLVDNSVHDEVTISAIVPAHAAWTVNVQSNVDGSLVATAAGVQAETGRVNYEWDLRNFDGVSVPSGSYSIVVGASVNNVQLATKTTGVVVAHKPTRISRVSFKKIDALHTRLMWQRSHSGALPIDTYRIRFSSTNKATWGRWSSTGQATTYTALRLRSGHTYIAEVVAMNQLGTSPSHFFRFTAK